MKLDIHHFDALLNERLPASLKVGLRKLAFLALRIAESMRIRGDVYPPTWMPLVGSGDFREIGQLYFHYFTALAGLEPTDSVLDVGCGLGRMAFPLTSYLNPQLGHYVGFDIEREAIEWCRRHITPRFPNFEFLHVAATNPNYVSGRRTDTLGRFPCADEAFDFVIVTSVFTHLLPVEVENYLSEISRALKPGGRCLMTFFLLNSESEALIAANKSSLRFVHDFQMGRVINPRLPQAAIAYPEKQTLTWLLKHGLQMREPIHYGNWCGREQFVDGQDMISVVRQKP